MTIETEAATVVAEGSDTEPKAVVPVTPEPKGSDGQSAEVRDEINRLKREIAKRDKADRQAEEQRAKDEGNYKQLAEEREARAVAAEEALKTERRNSRAMSLATELKFQSPEIAIRLISSDDLDDDKAARAAFKSLADDHPYLLAEPSVRRSASIEGGKTTTTDMSALIRRGAGRG